MLAEVEAKIETKGSISSIPLQNTIAEQSVGGRNGGSRSSTLVQNRAAVALVKQEKQEITLKHLQREASHHQRTELNNHHHFLARNKARLLTTWQARSSQHQIIGAESDFNRNPTVTGVSRNSSKAVSVLISCLQKSFTCNLPIHSVETHCSSGS